MTTKRMCNICGENPATVPDRERIGRPIKRVCGECHRKRLREDMEHILKCYSVHQEPYKCICETPIPSKARPICRACGGDLK